MCCLLNGEAYLLCCLAGAIFSIWPVPNGEGIGGQFFCTFCLSYANFDHGILLRCLVLESRHLLWSGSNPVWLESYVMEVLFGSRGGTLICLVSLQLSTVSVRSESS